MGEAEDWSYEADPSKNGRNFSRKGAKLAKKGKSFLVIIRI
jgi:hypothetical protein